MMQYKGCIGKIEFDPDAKILHGEVVGIRDVVTFQGSSVQEIENAFHESVDDYLSFCKERGEQPDKRFSGRFLLRVNADLHRSLDMFAHASGKSLNASPLRAGGVLRSARLALIGWKQPEELFLA
jgi:predicted HicB family RNase H-like nuclease